MHKISLDLTKTVNGTDVPLTLVAAMRNAIERGFTMADLVFNLTERGYDMVLVPKGMKNGMLVPLSPNELVQRIQKHQSGTHDQSSHGNWADKLSGTRTGDNKLDIAAAIELKMSSDAQGERIYAAQDDAFPYDTANKPTFNKKASDFNSYEEYNDAYRKYAQEFTEFARMTTKNIESPLAKKHLNGTPKGVKNYIQEFILQDWFVEAFGNAAFFPPLEINVRKTRGVAGQYRQAYNVDTDESSHGIKINTNFSQDERLLIHEIAHYATSISATKTHESHGREFAGNYLYIMEKQVGQKAADKLRKEFDKKGVKYTND